MNGDQIEKDATQVVKDVDADEFTNVSIVCAENGVYLRQNKIVDRNTDDAVLLPHGTFLLGHCETETSADNSYNWRQVIYLDGDSIQFGYIVDEYLLDTELSNFEGEIFEVNSEKVPLKLRTDPVVPKENSSSNIIEEMPHGSRVYLVPNVNSEWYDEEKQTQWLYVAYEGSDGEIKFGWCARSVLVNGQTVCYLDQVVKENIDDDIEPSKENAADNNADDEKSMYMRVDTSKDGGVDLKLRKKPDLDSDVVIRLENGTSLIVSVNDWNNQVTEDGYNWVKAVTASGEYGYVASEYLKEKQKVTNHGSFVESVLDLGVEGKKKGYIGIDCSPTEKMTPGYLESLLSGETELCQGVYRGATVERPNFVIIKLGSTGYGTKSPDQRIVKPDLYKESFALARVCEERGVPYTFYFFCAALPKEDDGTTIKSFEVDNENDYIVNALNYYVQNYDSRYFMPIMFMDIENSADRLACYNNPEQLTRMYNQQFAELDQRLSHLNNGNGMRIGIYSDHAATGYYKLDKTPIYNLSGIDPKYRGGFWAVDPSSTHSESWAAHPEANPRIRQIGLNCKKHHVDYDLIDSVFFEVLTDDMGLDIDKTNSTTISPTRKVN